MFVCTDQADQEDPEDSFVIRRRKPLVVLEVSSDDGKNFAL